MSTSSTWSASRTTGSGTVSFCSTPVICSTTSLSDSRCWRLIVEITLIPASSSSSTSCHRLACFEPGTLEWASSSTSTSCGFARGARRRPSPRRSGPGTRSACAGRSRGRGSGRRSGAGRGLAPSRSRRRSRGLAAPAFVEHRVGLADAGSRAEIETKFSPRHLVSPRDRSGSPAAPAGSSGESGSRRYPTPGVVRIIPSSVPSLWRRRCT